MAQDMLGACGPLVAIMKEYTIECGSVTVFVKKTKDNQIGVGVRKGRRSLVMDYKTWQLVANAAHVVDTAKALLQGEVGHGWDSLDFDLAQLPSSV